MKKTWILVADSARARIFTAEHVSGPLREVKDIAHSEAHLKDQDLVTDRPGRNTGSGGAHHALNDKNDPKRHEAAQFAGRLAEELEHGRVNNRFEQLILVAEPSLLGRVRDHLNEHLKRMISFELDKNLAQLDASKIREHLPEILPSQAV